MAEEEKETKKKNPNAGKESAEKLCESQKIRDNNKEARPQKSRKSIGDAVRYLQKKSKQEIALRKDEIEPINQERIIAFLSERQLKMQHDMLQMTQQQHQNQQRQQKAQQRQTEASAAPTSNHAIQPNPTATTVTRNSSFV